MRSRYLKLKCKARGGSDTCSIFSREADLVTPQTVSAVPQPMRKLLMDTLGKHKHLPVNHSKGQRGMVKRPNLKCGKPSF